MKHLYIHKHNDLSRYNGWWCHYQAAYFIGGNYLAKYLSGDSGQAALNEKERHDKALEKYQAAYKNGKRIAQNS